MTYGEITLLINNSSSSRPRSTTTTLFSERCIPQIEVLQLISTSRPTLQYPGFEIAYLPLCYWPDCTLSLHLALIHPLRRVLPAAIAVLEFPVLQRRRVVRARRIQDMALLVDETATHGGMDGLISVGEEAGLFIARDGIEEVVLAGRADFGTCQEVEALVRVLDCRCGGAISLDRGCGNQRTVTYSSLATPRPRGRFGLPAGVCHPEL